ncbi:MAG: hypothetical protein JNL28_14510 [Planctomycetes bacterium]|nr:hypothetical protein [Planctomycetota bacterium]
MNFRSTGILSIATALLATSAWAQTNFPETEPNAQKSEANAVVGIVAGDTITGVSTGLTTTLGSTLATTADMFRVRTAAAPLGIYRHTLTLTTSTTTGHTGTLRGLNQVAGVIGTIDSAMQTSSATIAPIRTNTWYGFGKQEEIYYRVHGTATTTAAYTATLSTSTITATPITGTFIAGPITVASAVGQTTDTEIYIYDGNLSPVPQGHNDDPISGGGAGPAALTLTLGPGTYYVAMSTYNTANNQSDADPNEFYQNEIVLDFPNAMANNSTATTGAMNYTVSDGTTTTAVTATHSTPFEIAWGTFTVTPLVGPPANDNCANAVSINAGSVVGQLSTATNDGAASCDPGGAASRDVWYSYTNGPFAGTLNLDTCGSSGIDTVVSVLSACGGAELACSDDCGGAPCGGPTSCLSVPLAPGQTVLIRVSDKALGGNLFSLNRSFLLPNDSCATPAVLPGPGTYPIDNSIATTGPEGQTETLCNFFGGTAIPRDLWYTYKPTTNGTVTVSTCGLIAGGPSEDSKIAIYAGAGCPTAGTAVACNDDFTCTGFSGLNSTVSFTAVCGTTYTIQIGMYQGTTSSISGSFSVTETGGTTCATPSTPFCLGDGTGAPCPCGNTGAAGHGCGSNAFAGGAILTSTGIAGASAGTDTLVLTATDIPGPGLFFQSNGLLATPANFGDGHLCAAVGIIRLGVVFPTAGVASYPGGLTPNPIHIQGGTANGQTKHYQCWYRSVPGLCGPNNYDLTQGLTLVWGP